VRVLLHGHSGTQATPPFFDFCDFCDFCDAALLSLFVLLLLFADLKDLALFDFLFFLEKLSFFFSAFVDSFRLRFDFGFFAAAGFVVGSLAEFCEFCDFGRRREFDLRGTVRPVRGGSSLQALLGALDAHGLAALLALGALLAGRLETAGLLRLLRPLRGTRAGRASAAGR